MKNITSSPWYGYGIALIGVLIAVIGLLKNEGHDEFQSAITGSAFIFIGLATAADAKKKQ